MSQASTSTATAPIRLTSSIVAATSVSDLDRSIEWYKRVLGFEVVFEMREANWAELATPVDGFTIGLGQAVEGQEAPAGGSVAITLGVEDIEAAKQTLLSHDVKIEEMSEVPGAVKLLGFYDPDGNALMFAQNLMQ
jgi:catechol 2,3-dioxygenase-like lactoylglutathione lyase family enzyme